MLRLVFFLMYIALFLMSFPDKYEKSCYNLRRIFILDYDNDFKYHYKPISHFLSGRYKFLAVRLTIVSNASNQSIFSKEFALIEKVEAILNTLELQQSDHAAFVHLLGGFRKTLRQCGRLMSIGDRMQAQLTQLNQDLSRMARTDPLTGLYNRRCFMETAEAEVERMRRNGKPLSLLMLDVDFFKRVNDTWGHDIGDLVLQTLSSCLLSSMRQMDTCARLGGEEFAVLLPETNAQNAYQVAERLRNTIANTPIPEHEFRITASLGLATLDNSTHEQSDKEANEHSVEVLLKYADIAMYSSKKNGRNRTEVYSSS